MASDEGTKWLTSESFVLTKKGSGKFIDVTAEFAFYRHVSIKIGFRFSELHIEKKDYTRTQDVY